MSKDKKQELRETAKEMLPDPIIIIGYLEHQLDLISKLVTDLASLIDPNNITPEVQKRLDMLNGLLNYSSVNFDNLTSPLESYKIPKAADLKSYTRKVQKRYLQKQIEEGIFEKNKLKGIP